MNRAPMLLARALPRAAPRLAFGSSNRWINSTIVIARSADRDLDAPKNPTTGNPSMFRSKVVVGGLYTYIADEPEKVNGCGEGPNPYDFLLTALGSCTTMTLKMYAERKGLADVLEGITVELSHKKVYASDCEDCAGTLADANTPQGQKIDRIERIITLHGEELTVKQRKRMLEIANMCPVHNTLSRSSVVVSKLVGPQEGGWGP